MDGDEKLEVVNAKIRSTMLGIEDHGIMTFMIHLEWQSCGQGLGGYSLDGPAEKGDHERKSGWGAGLIMIRKILETVGVDSWEKLPGTLVRLKVSGWGSSRPPIIGHIMEDKWFDCKEFAEANRKA